MYETKVKTIKKNINNLYYFRKRKSTINNVKTFATLMAKD